MVYERVRGKAHLGTEPPCINLCWVAPSPDPIPGIKTALKSTKLSVCLLDVNYGNFLGVSFWCRRCYKNYMFSFHFIFCSNFSSPYCQLVIIHCNTQLKSKESKICAKINKLGVHNIFVAVCICPSETFLFLT